LIERHRPPPGGALLDADAAAARVASWHYASPSVAVQAVLGVPGDSASRVNLRPMTSQTPATSRSATINWRRFDLTPRNEY